MADGYARSTGKAGVMCVVPGPGVTNSLTGLGEALVDSIPIVAIVGDIAQGEKYRPFQVHCLDQVGTAQAGDQGRLPRRRGRTNSAVTIRKAFALAVAGEPGPVAVVIPYTMLIEAHHFKYAAAGTARCAVYRRDAFSLAIRLLIESQAQGRHLRRARVHGILRATRWPLVAEMLQAPVATSVSGKGVIPETHPLAVGWGYGPQGTMTAEKIFKGKPILPNHHGVDCVLGDRRALQRSLHRLLLATRKRNISSTSTPTPTISARS